MPHLHPGGWTGYVKRRTERKMIPHLVPEYHRARLVVVICSSLIILGRLGVGFEGKIPLLNISLPDPTQFQYVLACILAYGLLRLAIEWAQSEPQRRRLLASRIDLTVTGAFGACAITILATELLPPISIPNVSIVSSVAIVAIGIAVGELIDTSIFNLFLIRSAEEARRLALPRVPVAVRPSYYMAYLVLPALLTLLLLTPSFDGPMSEIWLWLLLAPATVLSLSGMTALALRRHTTPDGRVLSRDEFIHELRAIHDRHDADYQVGGWDTRIPPSNTDFYSAAERGDAAEVSERLATAADPNERNQLGWTPLMISVANQHMATAELLLENGADPNQDNLLGRNSLMFAARYGNEPLVRMLLDHGANPNSNESSHSSALSAAADHGHVRVVRVLLEAGADPTTQDEDGRTPIEYAEAGGHGEVAGLIRRTSRSRESEQPTN